jgi:site-specific recombinase XerC
MEGFARAAVRFLGEARAVSSVTAADATSYLAHLRTERQLSPSTVVAYYSAFRRMLALAGYPPPPTWPNAPTPPRKSLREPMGADDLDKLIAWLRGKGWSDTADLAVLLRGTGLRVDVEALDRDATAVILGAAYDTLTVTGKGGHERSIPVLDPETRSLLRSPERVLAIRAVPYATHYDRWSKGVAQSGIKSGLASPHSLRHAYACHALERSGGNLVLVQELLGHSDPATTARYLKVDLGKKAAALG